MPGGVLVMSYVTPLIPRTSLMMRLAAEEGVMWIRLGRAASPGQRRLVLGRATRCGLSFWRPEPFRFLQQFPHDFGRGLDTLYGADGLSRPQ